MEKQLVQDRSRVTKNLNLSEYFHVWGKFGYSAIPGVTGGISYPSGCGLRLTSEV